MFPLEAPHLMSTYKENHPKLSQICSDRIFPRAQERVGNSHGKRATSDRATEVLLYEQKCSALKKINWFRGYKTFFMLNSVEHEILNPRKYENIKKFSIF